MSSKQCRNPDRAFQSTDSMSTKKSSHMRGGTNPPPPALPRGISLSQIQRLPLATIRLYLNQYHMHHLLFHCDNEAVVQVWQSGRSRCPDLMDLVRALFFVAARNNFHVLIRHIPGVDNSTADALSRLQLSRFHSLAPHASPHPASTPAELTFH